MFAQGSPGYISSKHYGIKMGKITLPAHKWCGPVSAIRYENTIELHNKLLSFISTAS